MALEGAEDKGEADFAATTSMEAAGVADTAATTSATDAVAADSTASATIVTRADICGAIATSSLMDGLLLKAKRVEEQEEGDEEAVEAVAVAEVVLQDEGFEEPAAVGNVTLHSLDYWVIDSGATYSMTPRADLLTELEPSPVKHVTSTLGKQAEVKGMGKAMFKGADGKMVGLKNVLWVPNLAANLISVRRLQKAGMDTSSKGAKTYTARLGERILWDLHEDRDVYNEMWQIPVVPMPKERQVAASISTKGEAVGSGDGANGRAKEIESKKCNLGGTSKLGEHEESGAAAKEQHKGEENPKPAAEEEYGESMWGTLRVRHSPIRLRLRGSFTRYPFSSSEATAKAPLDEVVMDVVGPLKLGAAGAEYFLTIVDIYTRITWVYVLSKKSDVAETVKTDWLPMVERQQDWLWYLKLREVSEEIGFTPSSADHSLIMLGEGEQRSFMVVYVDDILIFSPSSDLVKEMMLNLQDKFKCKALGDVSFYLRLHIERDVEKRCMRVHERKYLEALAANFGQSEGHVATPFPSGFKCVKGPEEESVGEEERRRFHSLVGSLIYAAVNTRPVSWLGLFNALMRSR
ncbi:unnamed protein product [Closterium sp. NIES-54]